MAADGEAEQNALLRGIIASVVAGTGSELTQGAGGTDSVAQLIAAAMTQLGQNIANLQAINQTLDESEESETVVAMEQETIGGTPNDDISFNPAVVEELSVGGAASDKVATSKKSKPICVKLPIETRKRIIAMRKEGKKCNDIAKELKVSVSGAEKVWERFLATGKVHDRKPSEYAGRPRKALQGSGAGSPVSRTHHVHVTDSIDVSHSDDVNTIDYTTVSGGVSDPPGTVEDAVVISGDSDMYVGGPLDMPGATVEIVETEPIPASTPSLKKPPDKKKPEYREQLLLKLVEGCPLAVLREGTDGDSLNSPHVANLATSITRPLYMESVLGHPFGRVPVLRPFDANQKEAEIILSDPANPVGKDLIAALGYSTKVYFNACCKPSPLFDPSKVLSSLPFCLEASFLADNTQKVLQLFLDLSKDPMASLEVLPEGDGPALIVKTSDGQVVTRNFPAPLKLSDYWSNLYKYASLMECCENFLSASIPSAPCLLCHPFEKLAQTLEIRDQEEAELIPSSISHHLSYSAESNTPIVPTHSHTVDSLTHHVEVQVLESGHVAMSSTAVTCDPIAEPTTIIARDSLSVVEDMQDKTTVPSSVHSNTQSKKGLSAGTRRRQPNGGSCSSRAVQGDEVEVDGQFDMPIPDTSMTGMATTGNNTLMTFVMTSEGLSQTMSAEEEKYQRCGSSDSPVSLQQDPSSRTQYQTPGPTAKTTPPAAANTTPPTAPTSTERMEPVKQKASVDAATQTTNGQLRPGVQDRTPLIIRRRPVVKTQKLALSSSSKKQLPSIGETNALKLVESIIGNGNETTVPACQEVQVQTQSPSEIETSTLVTEPDMETLVNEQGKQVVTHAPRRSSRKSAHKVSPSNEPVTMEESSSPVRRTSPRKSPAKSGNESPLTTPRIQTRALTKRTALEAPSEKEDVPLAKRTRKAVLEKSKESEDGEKLQHPQSWGVEEVVKYITSIQSDCAGVFREHEVDGESLLSLNPEMMVRLMNLKTGPALKIHRKITALKKQYGSLPSF